MAEQEEKLAEVQKEPKRRKSRAPDITGMRSGRVVAIERTDEKRGTCYLWRCRCDCGKELLLEPYKIIGGKVQSCGCQRGEKKIKDLTGQRFDRLVAIKRLDKKRGSSYLWLCMCDWGNYIETSANALLMGNTGSCGCKRIDALRKTVDTHGVVTDHIHLIDGTSVERVNQKKLQKNNTSGYTGVRARGDKWIAAITFKKKNYYLGIYENLEDAVAARKQAEEQLFGPFLEWYYTHYPNRRKDEQESILSDVGDEEEK